MPSAIITPPLREPLDLADVKLHLRIDHDHEDGLLKQLLTAATQYIEAVTGQRLITQVWRQYGSQWPADHRATLEQRPLQQVLSVTTYDHEGSPALLPDGAAVPRRGTDPAVLDLHIADPSLAVNGIEIDTMVGYGDFPDDVPAALRHAIAMLCAHWYEFRGAIAPGDQPVSLPAGLDALLRPWKRVSLR